MVIIIFKITSLSFIEDNQIYGVLVFSGDQHYPSGYILNWNTPLNSVSQTDSSIVYSLSELGLVVFDFSSSPLHYNRATGHALIPGNQNNPFYSFEIFRAELGHPSVYGLVEVDTENFTKSVAVTFYELDSENESSDGFLSVVWKNPSSVMAAGSTVQLRIDNNASGAVTISNVNLLVSGRDHKYMTS